jgi:hypothetical protein
MHFEGSPRNDEFRAGVSEAIEGAGSVYVLQTDISGYFLGISPHRLAQELMELTDRPEVVSDLAEVLELWQGRGVRGIPQGIRPSSPLANLYLASLDRRLGRLGVPFYRWADDMWAICASFAEARRVQDEIERHLYGIGLTLNGEKTRILRGSTAIQRLEPAKVRFERQTEQAVEDATVFDEYSEEVWLPDPEEVDVDVTHQEHDRLVRTLGEDDLPGDFHGDMSYVYRRLEAVSDQYALAAVPDVLRRAPDLTDDAMRYVTAVAGDDSAATEVFANVLRAERFTRDHEKLAICHMALSLKPTTDTTLAARLGDIALGDQHALTRARALVAWGRHSAADEFAVVDEFLESAAPQWRIYAFASIQAKEATQRDARYARWGSGLALENVAHELRERPIKWTRL